MKLPLDSKKNNPNYPFLLSYNSKKANDFEYAKLMMDYYNTVSKHDPHKDSRYEENFNLHRGAWPEIENLAPTTNINIYNENITLGGGKLYHFPLINTVSQPQVGDLISTPFIWHIKDTSTKTRNHRDKVRAEKVKQFYIDKYVTPAVEMMKLQFEGQEITPEIMQQIESEVMGQLPEEVMEDYLVPDEILADTLFRHVVESQKVQEKFDMGADFAVVVAEEYSMVYVDRTGPKMKALNGRFVEWGASQDIEACEDGEWARYTEYLTFQDFISKFGTEIKLNTIKEILDLYSMIPGSNENKVNDAMEFELTDVLASNPVFQDPNSDLFIDVRTRDGQEKLKGLYQTLSTKHVSGSGIKVTYITWRWSKNVKIVEDNNGNERVVDEYYFKNPARGDKSIRKGVVPQVWHGYIINDTYYAGIEPVPWQYDNLQDIYSPKLTIHGLKYNTFMGNTKNSSIVDLGKPFNFSINLLLKKLREFEATDIGKVLFLTSDIKPDKMTWGQWYSSLFQSRVALINKKFEGASVQQQAPIMVQDLSRVSDIGSVIEKLNWYESKLIRAMYYNPAKFGDINQYSTNNNTQLSLVGVDRQMMRFINKRRAYKKSVLTSLLNASISAFKDNEYMKELLLDDYLKVYYENNVDPFSASSLALFLVDDFEETKKVESMRNLALSIIQNGGDSSDISKILNADSMAEIETILTKSDKRKAQSIKESREHEMAMKEKDAEFLAMATKLKQEYDSLVRERDNQVKLEIANLSSSFVERGQDIDKNKIPDSLQKAIVEIQSKEKMHALDIEIEREKLAKQQF